MASKDRSYNEFRKGNKKAILQVLLEPRCLSVGLSQNSV